MVRRSRLLRSLIDADRAGMLALPAILLHLGWRSRIRVGRDYCVRLDTNDDSVDPTLTGRMVDVIADLERVRVRGESRVVTAHIRVWARGTTVTDPAHLETAGWLRNSSRSLVLPWPPVTISSGIFCADDIAFGLNDTDGII